jgi:hypothetical protein
VTTAAESEEFDEGRELCPDGNCLGVVVDGRCNVCGGAADGSAPTAPPPAAATAASPENPGAAEDGGWDDERRLCPDGACTGLLGPDGKCKECGRSPTS